MLSYEDTIDVSMETLITNVAYKFACKQNKVIKFPFSIFIKPDGLNPTSYYEQRVEQVSDKRALSNKNMNYSMFYSNFMYVFIDANSHTWMEETFYYKDIPTISRTKVQELIMESVFDLNKIAITDLIYNTSPGISHQVTLILISEGGTLKVFLTDPNWGHGGRIQYTGDPGHFFAGDLDELIKHVLRPGGGLFATPMPIAIERVPSIPINLCPGARGICRHSSTVTWLLLSAIACRKISATRAGEKIDFYQRATKNNILVMFKYICSLFDDPNNIRMFLDALIKIANDEMDSLELHFVDADMNCKRTYRKRKRV